MRKVNINVLFRKYHRQLSIVTLLPITLIALTGTSIPIIEKLGFFEATNFMIKVHTGKIFGLDLFYSVACGLGLLGLIITGIVMTGLVPTQPNRSSGSGSEPFLD